MVKIKMLNIDFILGAGFSIPNKDAGGLISGPYGLISIALILSRPVLGGLGLITRISHLIQFFFPLLNILR